MLAPFINPASHLALALATAGLGFPLRSPSAARHTSARKDDPASVHGEEHRVSLGRALDGVGESLEHLVAAA